MDNAADRMKRRPGLAAIAVLATLVICVQNGMSALAFGWSLIHGAVVAAFLAFVPPAIGIGLVWGGYAYWSRGNRRPSSLLFAAYVLGILALNEAILPSTPLQGWRARRALEAVEVRNVRDEVLRSARGNPIGIVVRFDVVFPRRVHGMVTGSTLGPIDGELPVPLQIYRGHGRKIVPTPARRDGESVFEAGVTYTVSSGILPGFLSYDDRTKEPCLRVFGKFPEAEFQAALARSRNLRLRGAAVLHAGEERVYKPFVTVNEYDLESMYQTIVLEGNKRCDTSG
jgi:hypothetical protein